jgi:hypothetical protein
VLGVPAVPSPKKFGGEGFACCSGVGGSSFLKRIKAKVEVSMGKEGRVEGRSGWVKLEEWD